MRCQHQILLGFGAEPRGAHNVDPIGTGAGSLGDETGRGGWDKRGVHKRRGASHLLLLLLPSRSPFSLRFRGGGLEHSVPATRQATQLSSSSPMTQSLLRLRQASQGSAESPLTESESGESKPLRTPEYESRCMLLWRLGGKRLGFGAMAMGAVRGTVLGADMV